MVPALIQFLTFRTTRFKPEDVAIHTLRVGLFDAHAGTALAALPRSTQPATTPTAIVAALLFRANWKTTAVGRAETSVLRYVLTLIDAVAITAVAAIHSAGNVRLTILALTITARRRAILRA